MFDINCEMNLSMNIFWSFFLGQIYLAEENSQLFIIREELHLWASAGGSRN